MCAPLIRRMNPRAEGPSLPEVSSTKGIIDAGEPKQVEGLIPQCPFCLLCCLIISITHCHVLKIYRCNLTKDRQTDTQTDRHTDTQTDRYTDTQEVPDAAAKAMETAKRNHYSAVKDPLQLPPASIIPFVLETSGRLGPSALGFIQRISGAHTYLRSQFFKEINFICAIYSGRMLEATREWMRANPDKWRA